LETDSRILPRRRRRLSTLRPSAVNIRRRKPCLFRRLRLCGWYVRFMFAVSLRVLVAMQAVSGCAPICPIVWRQTLASQERCGCAKGGSMNGSPDPESDQPNGSFPRAPPSRERRSGNGGSTVAPRTAGVPSEQRTFVWTPPCEASGSMKQPWTRYGRIDKNRQRQYTAMSASCVDGCRGVCSRCRGTRRNELPTPPVSYVSAKPCFRLLVKVDTAVGR